MEKVVARITIALKALGAFQVICGISGTLAAFLFLNRDLFDVVGEDIMMSGRTIQLTAAFLMFIVVAAGLVSMFRVPWGWTFSFLVASVVLVMALLMGPGSIALTKLSFLGLMGLSLINWAAAVVYYYHDLYT